MGSSISLTAATVRCLLLSLLLAISFGISIAGAAQLGIPASLQGMADPCANSADPASCYQKAVSLLGQGSAQADVQASPSVSELVNQPEKTPRIAVGPGRSEFQQFVAASLGRELPMYGYSLFDTAPDTFAPVENIPVTPDYPLGPGDEIVIKGWGQVDIDVRAIVDRNGSISIPKVGTVNVAGIRYQELQGYLKTAIGRVFRNFSLNVTLGKLRSIQVFVVGQARQPGSYTVSSLSTLVNTLFASGGPSSKGSLRHIQVKRNGNVVTEFDMYDLLLKGDKTRDVSLMPGDVIYIPPIGQLVAVSGSVNNPAIYELKDDKTTLSQLLDMAGGLTNVAEGDKVRVERIEDHKMRKVEEFQLDASGLARLMKDGDSVQVESIQGRFDNAVTLRGNVASPGRYPWKQGMHISDLIPSRDFLISRDYWLKQNRIYKREINESSLVGEVSSYDRAEINWDYAVVERLKRDDLTTLLIPFNLEQALAGGSNPNDLLLEEGDVVTIFSKQDIRVPVNKRSVFVRLEGEVNSAGVYNALPGETLRQLVTRVGGFTPEAFLFGAEFYRESARKMQQQRLEEMADRMEADIKRLQASKQVSAISQEDINSAQMQAAAQLSLVNKMRTVRATGRVVLEIDPGKQSIMQLPDVALEDGDRLVVPSKPSTASVIGMVYNENVFIYQHGSRVGDYLAKAGGPTRDADESRIYLLRADGSVLSSQNSSGLFNRFSNQELLPGDTVVVPEMLDRFSLTRELKDWAQIFYQFALGVGGIKMLRL